MQHGACHQSDLTKVIGEMHVALAVFELSHKPVVAKRGIGNIKQHSPHRH